MQKSNSQIQLMIIFFAGICLLPTPAAAYLGPGAGISAIGSVIALFAAVFVAIIGFMWYPIKRLMRKKKLVAAQQQVDTEQPEATTENLQK